MLHTRLRRQTEQAAPTPRRRSIIFCPDHGISISTSPRYVYKDHRRNFLLGLDLLGKIKKTETWRLGYETSEDAVSWNVFLALQRLRDSVTLLQLLSFAGIRYGRPG